MSGNRTLDARTARARVEALLTARGCDFESDGDAALVFPGELDDATCSVTLTLDDTTLGDEHATSEALSLTLAAVLPLPPVLALHRDRVDVLIGRAAPWVDYGAFEVDPDLGQVQLRYAWTLPADIGLEVALRELGEQARCAVAKRPSRPWGSGFELLSTFIVDST